MNIFSKLETFWLALVPPHALAISRILFGVFMFIFSCTHIPSIQTNLANTGVTVPLLYNLHTASWLLEPPPLPIAYAVFTLLLLAIVGFTIGYQYKLCRITILILCLYYYQLSLHLFTNSYIRELFLILCVFQFAAADHTMSVYAKQKWGSFMAWKPISILPQRMIAVMITCVYFTVAWQKMLLPDWQLGEILPWSFMGMWGTPLGFAVARLPIPLAIWDILLSLFKAWEYTLPFGLWHQKTRSWWVISAILFHSSVAILLSIWWFLYLIAFYIYFYNPMTVARSIDKQYMKHQIP